jgi:hypothetical protein
MKSSMRWASEDGSGKRSRAVRSSILFSSSRWKTSRQAASTRTVSSFERRSSRKTSTDSAAAESMTVRSAARSAADQRWEYTCGHLRTVCAARRASFATASQLAPAARDSTARNSTESKGGFLGCMGITGLGRAGEGPAEKARTAF